MENRIDVIERVLIIIKLTCIAMKNANNQFNQTSTKHSSKPSWKAPTQRESLLSQYIAVINP